MASYNKVLLMGNLTRDPELRYTPQGTAVANLGLAVSRKFRDKNQELREEVCFVTVVVWSKQAETCNQYLQKGSPVFIEGALQFRSWEDKSGQKRSVIEVRAERVQFLGKAPSKPQPQTGAPKEEVFSQEPAAAASTESVWLEESEEEANES